MPTLYSRADPEVTDLVAEVVERYHPPLAEAGVTIGCLVAEDAEDDGPVLKHHGYPAAAVVKIVPYKQRVKGEADVEITFDKATWGRLQEAERVALIDHELEHLELVTHPASTRPKRDAADRPKLRMVPHDFEIGGFHSIVRRHGRAALEAQQVAIQFQALRQLKFDWADDMVLPPGQPASTVGHAAGSTAIADEPADVDPDLWRNRSLAEALGDDASDRLWEAGEMETVGDLVDFLANGDTLEDLKGLEPADCTLIREAVESYRLKRGWADDQGVPRAWIEARPEEEAEKPKRRRKGEADRARATA